MKINLLFKMMMLASTAFAASATLASIETSIHDKSTNWGREFSVTATGHFCYQTFEDAYNQAHSELLRKANERCSPNPSQLFSDIQFDGGGCSIQLKGDFVCVTSDTPYCKPEKYWVRCCDKNGCWIEG